MFLTALSFIKGNKLAAGAVGILVVLLLVLGVYLKGRGDKAHDVAVDSAAAEAKADTKVAKADAAAEVSAVKDNILLDRREEQLKGADDATPDSRPSDARRALLCRRILLDPRSDPAAASRCRAGAAAPGAVAPRP